MTNSADWPDEYTCGSGDGENQASYDNNSSVDESCWQGLSDATRNAGSGVGNSYSSHVAASSTRESFSSLGLEVVIKIAIGLAVLGGIGIGVYKWYESSNEIAPVVQHEKGGVYK